MTQPDPDPAPVAGGKRLTNALTALRNCMATQLVATSRPVCNLPILWGEAPLPAQRCDCECADGGQGEGWIRIVRITTVDLRSSGRRSAVLSSAGCDTFAQDVTVEVGVWRCALTLAEDGTPPTDAEYDAHTRLMHADVQALSMLWRCCSWIERRYGYRLDNVVPAGPAGGCVGTIATGRIQIPDCADCP